MSEPIKPREFWIKIGPAHDLSSILTLKTHDKAYTHVIEVLPETPSKDAEAAANEFAIKRLDSFEESDVTKEIKNQYLQYFDYVYITESIADNTYEAHLAGQSLGASRVEKRLSIEIEKLKDDLKFVDLSTLRLLRQRAHKHAKSCKPNDVEMSSWCKSKEYGAAYRNFMAGAKCEYAWQMSLKDKNKQGGEITALEEKLRVLSEEIVLFQTIREAQGKMILNLHEKLRVAREALKLDQKKMKNFMEKGNIEWGRTFDIDFALMNESLIATDEALAKLDDKENG